jgi:hypothetical protein
LLKAFLSSWFWATRVIFVCFGSVSSTNSIPHGTDNLVQCLSSVLPTSSESRVNLSEPMLIFENTSSLFSAILHSSSKSENKNTSIVSCGSGNSGTFKDSILSFSFSLLKTVKVVHS